MSNPRSCIVENSNILRQPFVATTIIGLTTVLVFSFSGCEPHRNSQNNSEYPSAIEQLAIRREKPDPHVEAQTRGRAVYEHYCQICHGPQAQGNGFNAAMLDPPPRNFAEEAFWEQADDAHLQKVISHGGKAVGKSVLMPPWGRTLDESQILDVISFLRTVPELAKKAAEAEEDEPDDGE